MLHVVLAFFFFSCRGGRLRGVGVRCVCTKWGGFQTRPVLSFGVKSTKWHLFLLRLILNMLNPSPLLQVNTDFPFSPSSLSLKHKCQLTFPPKTKKRGENDSCRSSLKLCWTGTMIWIYTDECVDYSLYRGVWKSAIQCKFAFFFFIILTCFWEAPVLWGGCRCFPGLLFNICLL